MKNVEPVESRGRKAPWGPRPFTGSRVESRKSEARRSAGPRPSTLDPRPGFTLIELLVVIAIMGILAALILPVVGAVKKHQYLYNTQAEMAKLETAIDRYKAAYGFYPPSPTNSPTVIIPPGSSSLFNQLFYELEGTTGDGINNYTNLDGSDIIKATDVPKAFPGIGGFINCTTT